MKKAIIVLFGAPGCGKGYLGNCIKKEILNQKIVSENEINYISTGDLLRAEIASGSEFGQEIAQILNSGGLVDDEIVKRLLVKELEKEASIVFFDGYPRTKDQFDDFYDFYLMMPPCEVFAVKRDTPVELILERVSKRRVCKDCKTTHSVDEGCCPQCGGESIVRKDDAIIQHRLDKYEKYTSSLWDELSISSDDAVVVDGSQDAEEVAKELVERFFG